MQKIKDINYLSLYFVKKEKIYFDIMPIKSTII